MLNIPSPPPILFGRQKELSLLTDELENRKIVLVAGIGGIGKTALASQLALQHSEKEENNVIWVTCFAGWSKEEFSAAILDKFELVSGIQAKTESSEPGFRDIINVLDEKGRYLFLDDFHDTGEWGTEFIRFALEYINKGRLVLLSRARPALSRIEYTEVFELVVHGIDQEQTVDYLKSLEGTHEFSLLTWQRKEIADQTSGHPLAVKLAASLILSGDPSYSGAVKSEETLKGELERSFLESIMQKLSENERTALSQLSVFRLNLNQEKVVDRLGISRKILKSLTSRFLLELSERKGIFVQDVIREYLIDSLDQDSFEKFQEKAAQYCMADKRKYIRKEAYYHFMKAGEKEKAIDAAVALGRSPSMMGDEMETVFQIVISAEKTCNGYREQELIVSQIEFHAFRKRITEAWSLMPRIEEEEDRLLQEAYICAQDHKFEEAVQHYKKLMKAFPDYIDNPNVQASFGRCLLCLGRYDEAEVVLEKEVARLDVGDFSDRYKASLLLETAGLKKRQGYPEEAIVLYRKLLDCSECKSPFWRGAAYHNTGSCYYELRMYDEANETVLEAEKLAERYNLKRLYFYCVNMRGLICAYLGLEEDAFLLLSKCAEIAKEEQWAFYRAYSKLWHGEAYCILGKYTEARNFLEEAIAEFVDFEDNEVMCHVRLLYSQSLLFTGDPDKVIEQLDIAASLTGDSHAFKKISNRFYRHLAYKIKGDEEAASRYWNEYLEILSSIPIKLAQAVREEYDPLLKHLESSQDSVSVITDQSDYTIGEEQLQGERKKHDSTILFVDLIERVILVQGCKVPFFRKKSLVPLLEELVRNTGKPCTKDDLFRKTWNRERHPVKDDSILRKAISRIREMLDPNNPERFIKLNREGNYLFDPDEPFCVIYKKNS